MSSQLSVTFDPLVTTERLSTADVEFLHPSRGEATKPEFRAAETDDIIVRGSMKAKLAFVVACAMGEPVDRNWDEWRLWDAV